MLNQATLYNVEHQKSDLRALRQFIFSRWEEAGQLQPVLKSGLRWAFFTTEIVPHWAQSWLRPDNATTVEYDGGPMGERL